MRAREIHPLFHNSPSIGTVLLWKWLHHVTLWAVHLTICYGVYQHWIYCTYMTWILILWSIDMPRSETSDWYRDNLGPPEVGSLSRITTICNMFPPRKCHESETLANLFRHENKRSMIPCEHREIPYSSTCCDSIFTEQCCLLLYLFFWDQILFLFYHSVHRLPMNGSSQGLFHFFRI